MPLPRCYVECPSAIRTLEAYPTLDGLFKHCITSRSVISSAVFVGSAFLRPAVHPRAVIQPAFLLVPAVARTRVS